MRLTEKGIASLQADRPRDLMIDGRRGLILRLEPRDGQTRKTFRFRFKRDGKSSVVALGEYKRQLSVAEVETLHARCRQAVKAGGDPRPIVEAFHRERIPAEARSTEGPTVKDVCDEFLTYYAEKKRTRPEQARYLLEHNVLPKLGDYAAASIRKRDVQLLLDGIVERGSPILANRVQSLLKQAFAVAADRDLIEAVPTFPRQKVGGDEKLRTRVLSDEELRTLWHGLDKYAPPRRKNGTFPRGKLTRPLALALKLQLVTAQRRGEIAAAKWSDVIEEAVPGKRGKAAKRLLWRIPTNKSDRPHVVPLSPLAESLLAELREISSGSDYWLPSSRTGEVAGERDRSITKAARTIRAVLEMDEWRPHDLRRTARTNMARLGIREEVAERILNHAPTDRMVAVYNQHAYQDEMRDALNRWADHLASVVSSSTRARK
jgi:integrase